MISSIESQRDSVTQPRVARNELPWVRAVKDIHPERVAANPNGPAERVEAFDATLSEISAIAL